MVTIALIDHAALLIAPLIPIAALLALVGGAFAIFRKKKDVGGDKVLPEPVGPVEPGGPYLSMRQQQPNKLITAKLTKPSEAWAWTVSDGSSGVAGSAAEGALAMAAAFRTAAAGGFSTAPVTALAGGGGAPTLAIGFGNGEDQGWSITSSDPPAPGKLPTPPKLVASGPSISFPTAFIAVLAALSKLVPWITYEGDKSGADAPSPNGVHFDATDPHIESYHGLVISPNAVAVKNLAEWQGFIAPHLVALLKVTSDADAIMDDVLGRNMPENAKLNGKTVPAVRSSVQDMIDKLKDGSWISVGSPDKVLAALLVGSTYKPDGFAYQYKGHSVVVRKIGASTHEYAIWKGSRGLDTAVVDRGERVTKNQAIKAARARIDSGFKDIPPNPGPQVGEPPKAPPPPDQCKTIAHTWSAHKDTKAAHWSMALKQTTTQNIFSPYGSCDKFVMRVGVCVYVTQGSMGLLSSALAVPASSSMHISHFAIFEGNGQPSPGKFTHSDEFCWKRQFEAKLHRSGNGIVLDSFNTVDPVDELDACPSREMRWPSGNFEIIETGHTKHPWNPEISYSAQVKGNKLELSVTTVGLPHFVKMPAWPTGWGVVPRTFFANNVTNTKYRIALKGWSIGV